MPRFTSIALGNANSNRKTGKRNKKQKAKKNQLKDDDSDMELYDEISNVKKAPISDKKKDSESMDLESDDSSNEEEISETEHSDFVDDEVEDTIDNASVDASDEEDDDVSDNETQDDEDDINDEFNQILGNEEQEASNDEALKELSESSDEEEQEGLREKSLAIMEAIRHQANIASEHSENNAPISFGESFSSLSKYVSQEILDHVTNTLGFQRMTPIQQSCIPLLLSNKDIVAEAVTGSGKTLAYLLPMIEVIRNFEKQRLGKLAEAKIHDDEVEITRKIRGVVICPTRELTQQVYEIARTFESVVDELQVLLVTGGVERNTDFDNYSMIVATPGRLLELMMKKNIINLDLSQVEFLVLDEADKILELGFDTQVNAILKDLPSQRRTALYSATQTKDMYKWIKAGLRNPVRVALKVKRKDNLKAQATPLQLKNYYMICGYDTRLNQLLHLLERYKDMKIIVFFYTCAIVEYFFLAAGRLLKAKNIDIGKVFMLHGQLKQNNRKKVLESFRDAKSGVLFSTDVTSRGIDLPNISLIIQFDPPRDPQSYVHRAGRSARMGSSGSSLLFLSPEEEAFADYLRRKKIPLERMAPDPDAENMSQRLREMSLKDRELFEKSEEALKTFARSYKEHELSYIFDKKKVNYDDLCVGYGLIRKPPIDQLKTHKFKKFKWDASIDVDRIPYLKADQEKARRRKKLEALKQQRLEEKRKLEEDSQEKKELQTVTSFKQLRTELRADRSIRTRNKKKIYDQLVSNEIDYERKLLKLVKKKKISEKEYERLTGEAYFRDRIDGFSVNMEEEKVQKKKKKSKKRKRETMTAEERRILKTLKIDEDLLK